MHPDRTRTGQSRTAGLLFSAIALLCACTSSLTLTPPIRDPEDLIRRVISHSDSLRNARIRARVSIEIDRIRRKATSVLFYERPADLRMEISGSLGVSIMSAKFWGDSLRVYLPAENGILEGPAASVLYQVTGMNLEYYDVQRVMLGIPTLEMSDRAHITAFDTTADYYIVDLQHTFLKRKLWIDRANITLEREDITDLRGERLSQLRLSRYKFVSGCFLPQKIEIRQGLNHIAWTVESSRVNAGLDEDVFNLIMPDGVRLLERGK